MEEDNNESLRQKEQQDNGDVQKKPKLFKPPAKGRFKFSLWYFAVAAVVLLLINSFVTTSRDTTIEYSAFKMLIADGQIRRVEISDSSIVGYSVSSADVANAGGGQGAGQGAGQGGVAI